MQQTPTVYIVDDDKNFHTVISDLLESVSLDTHSYLDGDSFIEKVSPQMHGCIIMDIRMPGSSGLEIQSRLIENEIQIPIIFVTAVADIETISRAFKNGAHDLFIKPMNEQILIESIQYAIKNDKKRLRRYKDYVTVRARVDLLSPREKQVFKLVVRGFPNKKIAKKLGISSKTVEAHRSKTMRKMRVKSLADLIKIALEHGLDG